MSVAAFLSQLRRLDIRVSAEGDRLRCNAPAGALTDELREQVRQRKDDILRFLRMADALAAQQTAIVPLQQEGEGAPVFGVAHHGDVFYYRAFVQALGEERPFFALQPPGLDARSRPLARVDDLAAYFAAQIRAFRPHGPRIVAGYCMGGPVAYELAQQLLAAGEPAAFVALFGAPDPAYFRPLSMLRVRTAERIQRWRTRARIFAAQSARERLEYATWRARRLMHPDPALAQAIKVVGLTQRSVRSYEPQPFAVPVHHFIPSKQWASRWNVRAERWRMAAPLGETHYGPDGCTHDDMLQEHNARVFAEHFRRICARAGL